MLYDETAVKANIRNREGRRVFFLGREDRLTPSARDWLNRERIAILSGDDAKITRYRLVGGGFCEEKPEHMTHLQGDVLVAKTHPRIAFRGKIDLLEAELILCKLKTGIPGLQDILNLARRLIRCDVLEEPVGDFTLCGLAAAEQRRRSHFPQEHFGIAKLREQEAGYRELGWHYVDKIQNYYAIYRCDDPRAPDLYTDLESLSWAMKKQVRIACLRLLFWLVWAAVLFQDEWPRLLHEREAVVMELILHSDVLIPLYAFGLGCWYFSFFSFFWVS